VNHPPQFSGDPSDPEAIAAYADLLSAHARIQRAQRQPPGIPMHQHQLVPMRPQPVPMHQPHALMAEPQQPKQPKAPRASAASESGMSMWTILIAIAIGAAAGVTCEHERHALHHQQLGH